MRLGPESAPNNHLIVLIDREGNEVHRYTADRPFGRVQYDGRWFAAKRARKCDLSEMVYFEDIDTLIDDLAAGREAFASANGITSGHVVVALPERIR